MPNTSSAFLLAAIRAAGGPVRTADAERMLADSSWSCHRNTARKRLRSLAAAGHLTVVTDPEGRRSYRMNNTSQGDQ